MSKKAINSKNFKFIKPYLEDILYFFTKDENGKFILSAMIGPTVFFYTGFDIILTTVILITFITFWSLMFEDIYVMAILRFVIVILISVLIYMVLFEIKHKDSSKVIDNNETYIVVEKWVDKNTAIVTANGGVEFLPEKDYWKFKYQCEKSNIQLKNVKNISFYNGLIESTETSYYCKEEY
jgi:hypothetical protein